uniref:Uncharacterized protein n=1 Tax=Avena sativa TaxID=4498 RepID=A0ACD5TY30_AVESA
MALLKAVRVSDVPTLDVVVVPDIDAASAKQQQRGSGGAGRFAVIGHRGKGMNALSSPDRRLQEVKENSVRSFNEAARFPVDYVEFDVQVVFEYAKDRPIIFSSFQPDAAQLMRKLQSTYPVYFLTNGGTEIYADVRRNSLEEALKLCLASGMQGIVSEARAIFRFPAAIPKIKEADLSLLTYGTLNNVPEAVYMQHLMGVDGVIVDLVPEITKAISDLITEPKADMEIANDLSSKELKDVTSTPNFTRREISFLLRLLPELVQ